MIFFLKGQDKIDKIFWEVICAIASSSVTQDVISILSQIHWLDVPQRIQFKLGVTVHRCLRGNAPQCLVDCCKSTTDAVSRQRLRSASRHHFIVPRHRRTNFGRRAFTVAGPTACNSLPDYLRDPSPSEDTFK